jgi:hypothetical protein
MQMRHTYGSALALVAVTIPGHLDAQVEVPVLTGPQAQGDLIVIPIGHLPDGVAVDTVPTAGIQLVAGESTGNTHWLHQDLGSHSVGWVRTDRGGVEGLTIGYIVVPDGQTALLIHTDEHGASGVGPGIYRVNGKREMAEEIRRVQD